MAVVTGSLAAGGLALKALMAKLGIGAAAKAAVAKGGIGAGLNAAGKIAAVQGPRMAASGVFKKGLGRAVFGDMGAGEMAFRLGPDAFFGASAGMQNPGDLGDKLLAGTTSFVGGGLGGLGSGRIAKGLGAPQAIEAMVDMAGSVGGDYVGMDVGDKLQRGKDKLMGGAGQTAWERMSSQQQKQLEEQIRNETLREIGLMPREQSQYFGNSGLV